MNFRSTLYNWVTLAGANGISVVFSLCTLVILARSVSVETMGIFALIQSYVKLVDALVALQSTSTLIKMGMTALSANRVEEFRTLVRSCFIVEFTSESIATAIAVVGIAVFSDKLGLPESTKYWAFLYCVVIPTNAVGSSIAVLRLFDRFFLSSLRDIVGAVIRIVGTVVVAAMHWKPIGFLLVMILADLGSNLTILAAASIELAKRGHRIRSVPFVASTSARSEFWNTLISAKLTTTIRSSTEQGDTLLVGLIFGLSGAAYLRIAKAFSSLIVQFGWPIHHVIAPQLTQMWITGQFVRLKSFLFNLILAASVVGVLAFLCFLASAKPIIGMVYGAKYVEASQLALIYFAAYLLMLVGTPILPCIFAMGRPIIYTYIHIAGAAAFALFIFAFFRTTILATGIGHMAYISVWLLLGYTIIFRAINARIYVDELVPGVQVSSGGSS